MAGLGCMWGAVDSNAAREGKTRQRPLAVSEYLYNIRFLFLSRHRLCERMLGFALMPELLLMLFV